jgi:hypothetical protein
MHCPADPPCWPVRLVTVEAQGRNWRGMAAHEAVSATAWNYLDNGPAQTAVEPPTGMMAGCPTNRKSSTASSCVTEVDDAAASKRAERGGFTQRLWLDEALIP